MENITKKEQKKIDSFLEDNISVYKALANENDNSTAVREVTHYVYFKKKKYQDKFLQELKLVNFSSPVKHIQEATVGLGVILFFDTDATPQTVDEYCKQFVVLASRNKGDYDGWETQIVREEIFDI